MTFPLPITRVAFGVRYAPQYKIRDRLGDIIDKVLYAKGTPFGPEFFPMSQSSDHGHRLVALEGGEAFGVRERNSLTINERDSILVVRPQTRGLDEIKLVGSQFVNFVLKVIHDSGINQIARYGMLLECSEIPQGTNVQFTRKYLGDDDARDLVLRYSRRLATTAGAVRSEVNDYRKVIFTVQQSEEGKGVISIDYQEHFDPALDRSDINHRGYDRFCLEAVNYFQKNGSTWVAGLIENEKAA